MSEEITRGKGLPILKRDSFGMTDKDVKRILKETEDELKATQEGLAHNPVEREGIFGKPFKKCSSSISGFIYLA